MDPRETVSCPHCSVKKPFACSKCSTPINHHDIYGIEKLKTKKPLLCLACGHENEVLKCHYCNLSLMRSQGITKSDLPGARIYHKKCYDERVKALTKVKKFVPATLLVFLVAGVAVTKLQPLPAGITVVFCGALFVVYRMIVTVMEPQ